MHKTDYSRFNRYSPLALVGDARFGDPEFTPAPEGIEEHESCFEFVFVFTEDGYGIEIFVPKLDGVDRELLTMCEQFAVPSSP